MGAGARTEPTTRGEALAVGIARLMSDDKCENVVVLDVRGLSQVTDYLVIGTGTSDRQMVSVLDDVEALAESEGAGLFRREKDSSATWLIADFVDVVAHVFEPTARAHYDLEMLWGDAERVPWRRMTQSAERGRHE